MVYITLSLCIITMQLLQLKTDQNKKFNVPRKLFLFKDRPNSKDGSNRKHRQSSKDRASNNDMHSNKDRLSNRIGQAAHPKNPSTS